MSDSKMTRKERDEVVADRTTKKELMAAVYGSSELAELDESDFIALAEECVNVSPEPFPYHLIDDVLDLVADTGRISTCLTAVGISTGSYYRLLLEAKNGDARAMDTVEALLQARALFEVDIIQKAVKDAKKGHIDLLQMMFPNSWRSAEKKDTVETSTKGGGNNLQVVHISTPDNNRSRAPTIDVTEGE